MLANCSGRFARLLFDYSSTPPCCWAKMARVLQNLVSFASDHATGWRTPSSGWRVNLRGLTSCSLKMAFQPATPQMRWVQMPRFPGGGSGQLIHVGGPSCAWLPECSLRLAREPERSRSSPRTGSRAITVQQSRVDPRLRTGGSQLAEKTRGRAPRRRELLRADGQPDQTRTPRGITRAQESRETRRRTRSACAGAGGVGSTRAGLLWSPPRPARRARPGRWPRRRSAGATRRIGWTRSGQASEERP